MPVSPQSHRWELNPRPLDYESSALPLSYCGDLLLMPWRGFEPRRLAAPPPQDGVSTSFTTRALTTAELRCIPTGPTGLEPATSRVTVECSNQTELRPLSQSGLRDAYRHHRSDLLHRVSPRSCPPPARPSAAFIPHATQLISSRTRNAHVETYGPHSTTIARRGIEPLSAP